MTRQGLNDAVGTRFFMPSAELAPYISTYYITDFVLQPGETVRDWLHPEWANVRMADTSAWQARIGTGDLARLPRIIGTGPTGLATQFSVTGPMRSWGIGILPLGWLRLFPAPANEVADQTVACGPGTPFAEFTALYDQVFAGPANPAAEAARIDAFLLDLLSRRPPHEDEARIRQAHAALLDETVGSVADLAGRLGISARSLERLSLRAFGFPPKLLLRRQRFLRSLAQFMLDPSLKWIGAMDPNYHDQAQFVRDFREFMGLSPREYSSVPHPVLERFLHERLKAQGAPVQTLDKPSPAPTRAV